MEPDSVISQRSLLKQYLYTGDLKCLKQKINYNKKTVKRNSTEHIIAEIRIKQWLLKIYLIIWKHYSKNGERQRNSLSFDDLLYCRKCKDRMIILHQKKTGKNYIFCNCYKTYSKYIVRTIHTNNYDKLKNIYLSR